MLNILEKTNMKSTTNVFLEGLRMDLHPLATGLKLLTDALNATLITFNGNEMMLQNDMGNTLILDTATGNIMGLSPGFTPIGLKEHGGIMYIASVNKDGVGEIGTIPSPIIRNLYKEKVTVDINQSIPINTGDPIRISNKLYPADKFISNLLMSFDRNSIKGGTIYQKVSDLSTPIWDTESEIDPNDVIVARNVITKTSGIDTLYTPLISYNYSNGYTPNSMLIPIWENSVETLKNLFSPKGVYKLNLYTQHNNIGEIKAPESLLSQQMYLVNGSNKLSNYWYLHTLFPTSVFPKDLLEATLSKDLKLFPSSNKPGYMAIKLETEGITSFNMLPRKEKPYDTPITLKTFNSKNLGEYCVLFPGFYYSTESGIYIDKLKDIRLIDESTSDTVDIATPDLDSGGTVDIHFSHHDIQSITTGEGLLGKIAYTPYYRPSSTIGEFPQIQSEEDDLTFLLTTVPDVFNHTTTEFLSATASGSILSAPSHTTGLMYSDIGSKYNNWYRLELDYYDQYDNKLGTFAKRFNPYLNDVFGTNLCIDGWVGGCNLVIGKPLVIDKDDVSISESRTITCLADKCYNIPFEYPSDRIDNYTDYLNIPIYHSSEPQHYNKLTWDISNIEDINVDVSSYINKIKPLVTSSESVYIYPIANQIAQTEITVKGSCTLTSAKLYATHNTPVYKFHMLADDKGFKVLGEHTLRPLYIWVDSLQYTLYKQDMRTAYNMYWTTYNNGTDVEYTTVYPDMNNRYFNYKKDLFGDTNMKVKISDILNGTIKVPYKAGEFGEVGTIDLAFGTTLKGDNVYPLYSGYIGSLYTSLAGDAYKPDYYGVLLTYLSSISLSLPSFTLSPYYSITPFLCLTGTSENGNSTYIQRFGSVDGVDLVYLHNFELGADSQVYNYIVDQSASTSDDSTAPCSYNLLDNSHKFWYKKDDFVYKLRVQAGIYVLNILRCPDKAMWIMNANNSTTTEDDVTLVDLSIKVNAKSYSYDQGTIPYWITTPKFTDGIFNNQTAISESRDRLYVPIVIIVRSELDLEITITSKNESHPFTRLSIGLYKILDVTKEDIKLVNLLKDVYSYNSYMKIIQQKALEIYNQEPIKLYTFILKYGVFFKEAYVFIDGILDGKLIKNITVDGETYKSVPYIPKDPSVLPVYIDSNYDFIWNAYIMPKLVLQNPDLLFVFTNTQQFKFSTNPGLPNSLRHVVTADSYDDSSNVCSTTIPLSIFPINY